jgi:pSer/pThr/pTyr-binding forkhead associated (FHA) protein
MALQPPQWIQGTTVIDVAEVVLEVEVDAGDNVARFVFDLNDGPDGVHGVVTLGRVAMGNNIVLPSAIVAKRHLRIEVRDMTVVVTDLASTGSTWAFWSDRPPSQIRKPTQIAPYEAVYVGHYKVRVGIVPRTR